jgi:hypothetical protein
MLVDSGGLPGNALIDTGKDFKSRWFAGSAWEDQKVKLDKEGMLLMDGILQECGCKAHFATPYRGQSKPIERLLGTIIQLFSKARDFYTGSDRVDTPEDKQLYWKRINGRDRIEVTYTMPPLPVIASYGNSGQAPTMDTLAVHFTKRDFKGSKEDTNLVVSIEGAFTAPMLVNGVPSFVPYL